MCVCMGDGVGGGYIYVFPSIYILTIPIHCGDTIALDGGFGGGVGGQVSPSNKILDFLG